MCKPFTLLIPLLLFYTVINAQPEPKIGSEKGVKEKLLKIKNALPDFKKTLAKPLAGYANTYEVKVEIGNGEPLFEEDKETTQQTLVVNFSGSPYFSGTKNDFQKYYGQLSTWLKEIFGKTHQFEEEKEETIWTLSFIEKGKDYSTSPTYIELEFTSILSSFDITLTITTYPKGKVTDR